MNEAEKKEKKKMGVGQTVVMVLCIVIAVVLLLLLGARLFFRLPVWDYYRASEKGFKIPGLSDGFVAQGLDFDGNAHFWSTGYMKDGSASPVYLIEQETGKTVRTLYLAWEDGSAYNGHAGGIAVNYTWDYVYVAAGEDNCVLVYDSREMAAAEDGATVKAIGRISTKVSDEDYLQPACLYMDMDRGRLLVYCDDEQIKRG